MIRHLVLLRFRPEASAAARAALLAELGPVVAAIPGCSGLRIHRNDSPEPLSHGFEDGFQLDFDDAAARDRYLADPAHAAIGARIVAATEGGTRGVLVFDHAL